MDLKELKKQLEQFPPEMDNCKVVFGETAQGEQVKKIKKLGNKVVLSFF